MGEDDEVFARIIVQKPIYVKSRSGRRAFLATIDELVASLEIAVSPARLRSYRGEADDARAMLVNYFWNIALCEALYPVINGFELALRNRVDAVLREAFDDPLWFLRDDLLDSREVSNIKRARTKLGNLKMAPTPGQYVAGLEFGFWVGLWRDFYEAVDPARPNKLSWIGGGNDLGLVVAVFPHAPSAFRSRSRLNDVLNRIKTLRNRAFHHEPVWNMPGLQGEHENIITTLGWIDPDMAKLIRLYDRFPTVFAHGRHDVEQMLALHFLS